MNDIFDGRGLGPEVIMQAIKLVCADVDGVLTDGKLYYQADGTHLKAFNARDGLGIKLLIAAGVRVAFITGLQSPSIEHRAHDLGAECYFEEQDKAGVVLGLLEKYGLTPSELACIGDDIQDREMLKLAAFAFCPLDAHVDITRIYRIIKLRKCGGAGAFRAMSDLILATKEQRR